MNDEIPLTAIEATGARAAFLRLREAADLPSGGEVTLKAEVRQIAEKRVTPPRVRCRIVRADSWPRHVGVRADRDVCPVVYLLPIVGSTSAGQADREQHD